MRAVALSILASCAKLGVVGKRVENPRLQRFTLVLTDAERQLLERNAASAGLTMSQFIRERVFVLPNPALHIVQCSDIAQRQRNPDA